MLVGDLIQAIREAITDQPQYMAAPASLIANAANLTGGTVPPGTYFIVVTAVNPWGETLPSPEVSVTVTAPQNAIQLTFPGPNGNNGNFKMYFGFTAGGETGWVPVSGNVAPLNVLSLLATNSVYTNGGSPPTRPTAYLPDTDGAAVGAYTMFRWLNDALKQASQVCGGLFDYSGVSSIAGQPQYITPGQWKKISTLWYDGYPVAMDDAGNYFRRNNITASILSSVATSLFTDRMMLEVWPQPARTAAQTTLASQMLIGQTTAQLTSAAGFLLGNGFVQIGTEIMSYAGISGNTLQNLQRGLSGTVQGVIPAGTNVQELNIFWQGWREYNPNFQPGSSYAVVPVPLGWETILFEYGLGRMKLAEQDVGEYSKLTESFKKQLSDWYRTNKVTTGPRQVGDQTQGLEVLPSLGGGWVIP